VSGAVDDARNDADPAAVAAVQVFEHEVRNLLAIAGRFAARADDAIDVLASCPGTVVITGLGKSGLIGAKISATFASTGTHSLFVHASEALHGDLGRLRAGDVLIALSQSGTTTEVLEVCRVALRRGVPIVALTGSPESELGALADVVVETTVDREADPLDLVPTTSTTLALVVGDALAVGLMVRRGLTADQFADHHPGGSLGRRLLGPPEGS